MIGLCRIAVTRRTDAQFATICDQQQSIRGDLNGFCADLCVFQHVSLGKLARLWKVCESHRTQNTIQQSNNTVFVVLRC
jgi:hypothetical protein